MELTIRAARLSDGRTVVLAGAVSLEITRSLDSPAESFAGRFALEAYPGELGSLEVEYEGAVLFRGKVDAQSFTLWESGMVLTLDARSKGALLLDNEAMPCVLTNVRLGTVFGLFCQPYGFLCVNPQSSRSLATYTVRAGMSEWEALTGYTRRAYGVTPYVFGDQVVVDSPRSGMVVRISNTGEGLPFTRLDHSFTPYKVVSDVIMRDEQGRYSASVRNSSAAHYGVRRKRYVIPQNEFMDALQLDANQRIRRSMLDMQETVVTLPGRVELLAGQQVELVDDALTVHNLLVRELRWQLDNRGLVTRLWLVSSVYY